MRLIISVAGVLALLFGASLMSGCAVIGHAVDDAVWGHHHGHHHKRHRPQRHHHYDHCD